MVEWKQYTFRAYGHKKNTKFLPPFPPPIVETYKGIVITKTVIQGLTTYHFKIGRLIYSLFTLEACYKEIDRSQLEVTEYRGLKITKVGEGSFTVEFAGFTHRFNSVDKAHIQIDLWLDNPNPPIPPPKPKARLQCHIEDPFTNADFAKNYDIAVCLGRSETEIRLLRAANPNIKLYAYVNFQAVENGSADYLDHKDNNALLMPAIDNSETIRDLTKKWVQDRIVSTCDAVMFKSRYDGIMSDNFPTPTVPSEFRIGIAAYNQFPYSKAEWIDAQMSILQRIPYTVIGNGIPQADGPYGYYANYINSERIIQGLGGIMIEGPVAWSHTDLISRSAAKKQQNEDFVKRCYDTGKPVLFSNTGYPDMENNADCAEVIKAYLKNTPREGYTLKFRGRSFMEGPIFKNELALLS